MNHTEHYQLSQWDKADRILMDDFNADNAKLDAALSSLAGRPGAELLASTAGTERTDKTHLELDVSGVDWSRYFAVVMDFKVFSVLTTTMTAGLKNERCVRIGQDTTGATLEPDPVLEGALVNAFNATRLFTLFPCFYNPEHSIMTLTFTGFSSSKYNPYPCLGSSNQPYSAMQTLRFESTGDFFDSDHLNLWGLR